MDKKIWIGCDHGGFLLKQRFIKYFEDNGIPCHDAGPETAEHSYYPDYASPVARAVSDGEADRGVLICSSGVGMSIIANKFKGVRASLCTSSLMGRMTRTHNDSNILCLGAKFTGEWEALETLREWLEAEYEGGRHEISMEKIRAAEEENFRSWLNIVDNKE